MYGFSHDLRSALTSIPNTVKIFLLVDQHIFGRDHVTLVAIGKYDLGKMDSDGLRLFRFYTQFELAICYAVFQRKEIHKVTRNPA